LKAAANMELNPACMSEYITTIILNILLMTYGKTLTDVFLITNFLINSMFFKASIVSELLVIEKESVQINNRTTFFLDCK
jgi:hypothetical protein